jgi:hypothetical protein
LLRPRVTLRHRVGAIISGCGTGRINKVKRRLTG